MARLTTDSVGAEQNQRTKFNQSECVRAEGLLGDVTKQSYYSSRPSRPSGTSGIDESACFLLPQLRWRRARWASEWGATTPVKKKKKNTASEIKEAYRGLKHPHVKGPSRCVRKGNFFCLLGCCGRGQSLGTEGRFERREWLDHGSFKGLPYRAHETIILCDRHCRLTAHTRYSTRHLNPRSIGASITQSTV